MLRSNKIAEGNKHRQPHTFQQGDKVLLSTKNLPITYATARDYHRKTLHHKYIGEFELGKQRGENAFPVLLPSHWCLAHTFNVDRLKHSKIVHSRPKHRHQSLEQRVAVAWLGMGWGGFGLGGVTRSLEYEVKWEDNEELSWKPDESFGKGGKDILEEFKKRDVQPQKIMHVLQDGGTQCILDTDTRWGKFIENICIDCKQL